MYTDVCLTDSLRTKMNRHSSNPTDNLTKQKTPKFPVPAPVAVRLCTLQFRFGTSRTGRRLRISIAFKASLPRIVCLPVTCI